ncbi:MAG: RNA methyltransferase [Deltaproteobacteria bacterium]|nr:RNA methyltransferase [Deltaproteobacteria bacterium]
MSGTDRQQQPPHSQPGPPSPRQPAIVLVEPQLGENIGTTARAMYNCGLTDLRLVRPRDGWPNPRAEAAASGADPVLESVRLFDSVSEAVGDLTRIYATSARSRDMVKPVVPPRLAAAEMRACSRRGETFGVLFGPERTGLTNDHVVLADALLAVPLNPAFSSLNLAQAVLLISYEWMLAKDIGKETPQESTDPRSELPVAGSWPATAAEVDNFLQRMEAELIDAGFLYPEVKRPIMLRNLRNIFRRARLTDQEVRTLHGVVRSLSGRRNRRQGAPDAGESDASPKSR